MHRFFREALIKRVLAGPASLNHHFFAFLCIFHRILSVFPVFPEKRALLGLKRPLLVCAMCTNSLALSAYLPAPHSSSIPCNEPFCSQTDTSKLGRHAPLGHEFLNFAGCVSFEPNSNSCASSSCFLAYAYRSLATPSPPHAHRVFARRCRMPHHRKWLCRPHVAAHRAIQCPIHSLL